MPKYIIERNIPGIGAWSPEQLKAASLTSCGVIRDMGPRVQWLESYVTDDILFCTYIAADEATVREHAQKGGFPVNRVSQIHTTIDPTTAE